MTSRLADCRFLHGSHYPDCTAVVDKRFAGYCTLQFITRGTLELSYNAWAHVIGGRWTFPAFPGPRIRFHRAPGCASWDHRYVAVTGPLVDHWRATGLWPEGPEELPTDVALEPLFDAMLGHFRGGRTLRGANALEGILLLLAERRTRPTEGDWVAAARERLAEPDGFHAGVAELAQQHGCAASTFRRRFKAATGVSPQDWAIHARLERARDLLAGTTLAVGAVAEQLGYRDVYFFSRQFTRHTGLSPRAWRQSRL